MPADESVVSHHRACSEGQRDGHDRGESFGNGRHSQANRCEEHQEQCFTAQHTHGEHDGADHEGRDRHASAEMAETLLQGGLEIFGLL